MKSHYFLSMTCLFLALVACGSGSSDIPNVAGGYDCSTNCSGACDFPATITITQSDESIIIEADNGNQVGTINDSGEIDTTTDDGSCTGQIVQGTAILICELNDTDCQQVTYKHQ